MFKKIGWGLLGVVLLYVVVQSIRCAVVLKGVNDRLQAYSPKVEKLSYGQMSYVDRGQGVPILSVHGIFGGYDQAYDAVSDFSDSYRIIAPSRFGYLGSDVKGGGTPAEQADAFVELLDALRIDKIYVLGASAGGTVAIRFALDHPERTKGLILYCSAPPLAEKPDDYLKYQGPPAFLCHDYPMFLLSPFFEPVMGMAPSTIYTMLPISERREGVDIDASITNPDLAKSFDDYPIENLQVPTIIFHAKDDKIVPFGDMEKAVPRFPNCTFVPFETGGHLMKGNSSAIHAHLTTFMNQ